MLVRGPTGRSHGGDDAAALPAPAGHSGWRTSGNRQHRRCREAACRRGPVRSGGAPKVYSLAVVATVLAARVAEFSEAPMIQNLKKILAPIDFSEYSMEALRGAIELAKDLDGEVHMVHVVAPHFALLDNPREQARETLMLEEAAEYLARITQDDYGNSAKLFTHVMIEPPVPKLVEYAKQQQIRRI